MFSTKHLDKLPVYNSFEIQSYNLTFIIHPCLLLHFSPTAKGKTKR